MQVFTTLIATASLALAVSAVPIESRDKGTTYITCNDTPVATGVIYNGDTYFGLGSTTTTGSDGNVDQVLVSLDNGKAFTAETATKFEFIQCKSKYLGTDVVKGTFGYLNQPGTKNGLCVQTKTGSVDTPDQVMVSSVCSRAEGSEQQNQSWELFADGGLKFISTRLQANSHPHPTYFTTSTQNHKALKLNAGSIPKGSDGAAILGFKQV